MSIIELTKLARSTVGTIVPYEPGKPISEVQREYHLKDVIKLASNENPLGPSPKAIAAVRAALDDLNRYPDGAGYYLKEKLSARFGVPMSWLVLGNGSTELVELVCEAFVGEGDEVVIGRYEFFKYRIGVQIMNGAVRWAEMPNLGYDVEALLNAVTPRTKALFIANPNNPTGTLIGKDEVEWLMARIPKEVLVVFDEAYYDYRNPANYPDVMRYLHEGRNVAIFRTFSKSYGLAGLRVGYAVTLPAIAQALNTVREAFNVNSLGQIAAAAALDDEEFLQAGIRLNAEGKAYFYAELKRLGLEHVPSEANFILIKTPIPGRDLFKKLLEKGVVVRPVDGYGLKDYIRVSIGLKKENETFFKELAGVV
jgi:histidinol-phosphate aminotransferase